MYCLFDSELLVQNYTPKINSHCCMQLYLTHFLCNILFCHENIFICCLVNENLDCSQIICYYKA